MHPAQTPLHLIPGTTHRSTLRIMQPTWVYKPATSTITLRNGSQMTARGTEVPVGQKAFVVDGQVMGQAPALPQYEVEV